MNITNAAASNPLQSLYSAQSLAAAQPAQQELSTAEKVSLEAGVNTVSDQDSFTQTGASLYSLTAASIYTPEATALQESSSLVKGFVSKAQLDTDEVAQWTALTPEPSVDLVGTRFSINGITVEFTDSSKPTDPVTIEGTTTTPVVPPNVPDIPISPDPGLFSVSFGDEGDTDPLVPSIPDIGSSLSGSDVPFGDEGDTDPVSSSESPESGAGSGTGASDLPAGDSRVITVDINGLQTAQDIRDAFLNKVNTEVKAAIKANWSEEFGIEMPDTTEDICTWEQNADGVWSLSFKQPEQWTNAFKNAFGENSIEGSRFDISCEMTLHRRPLAGDLTPPPLNNDYTSRAVYYVDYSRIRDESGFTDFGFMINDVLYSVVQKPAGETRSHVLDEGGETGTIYLDLEDRQNFAYNLCFALNDICSDISEGNFSVGMEMSNSGLSGESGFWIALYSTPDDQTNTIFPLPSFAVVRPQPDLIQNVSNDVTTDFKHHAYIEYQIDLDALERGASFVFRDVEFVFDPDGQKLAGTGKKNEVFHISASSNDSSASRAGESMLKSLTTEFNRYFGERTSSYTPAATGGASGSGWLHNSSGTNNAFKNLLAMLKSGAFNMSFIINGSIATVTIEALADEVLDEDKKIGLEEDEGWESAEDAKGKEAEPEVNSSETPIPVDAPETESAEGAEAQAQVTPFSAPRAASAPAAASTNAADDKESITDPEQAQEELEEAQDKIADDPAQAIDAQSNNLQAAAVQQLTED